MFKSFNDVFIHLFDRSLLFSVQNRLYFSLCNLTQIAV